MPNEYIYRATFIKEEPYPYVDCRCCGSRTKDKNNSICNECLKVGHTGAFSCIKCKEEKKKI